MRQTPWLPGHITFTPDADDARVIIATAEGPPNPAKLDDRMQMSMVIGDLIIRQITNIRISK